MGTLHQAIIRIGESENSFKNLEKAFLIFNVDAHFYIYQDELRLGQIIISKGGFDYYPANSKKPIIINWTQFDKLIRNWKKR